MDDARVIAMPVAARGMLLNLVWHFWLSECAELPKDQDRLFAISQAHKPTWSNHSRAILAVLRDAAPKFLEAYGKRQRMKEQLRRLSYKGGGATALNALREKSARSAPLQPSSSAPALGTERRQARRAISPAPVDGGFSDKL